MILIQKILLSLILVFLLVSCSGDTNVGETEIMKWKDGKQGAISITLDDGSPNQFRKALPILNRLEFPATFFIVTGEIPGSENPPRFVGRPVEEIIEETKTIPTDKNNFFERASAIAHLGYKGTWESHLRAGSLYERGRTEEAHKVIDDGYASVRAGKFRPGRDVSREAGESAQHSWDDYRAFAAQDHEFGSHTISHPRLAVLDEKNIRYELEGSREEIRSQLGPEHTFSAEGPFGTIDERVMEYLLDIYPASRNRMPHPWLTEIHRGEDTPPGASDNEYVQWQRGPLTDVPMDRMKSWVDTLFAHDNIWLVLVFHGVDDLGWQPRTSHDLETYFGYVKEREDHLWIATFGDVSRYMRQRMNAEVSSSKEDEKIVVDLIQTLDRDVYRESASFDLELTLKTCVPGEWNTVTVVQGEVTQNVQSNSDESGRFVMYQATPNAEPVELTPAHTH